MKEGDQIERFFIASLHRALTEIAPERLETFQKWFDPGDRRPRFHIAPVIGALGYLRKDPPFYRELMEQAAEYGAEWTYADLPPFRRRLLRIVPRPFRDRSIRKLLLAGVRNIHRDAVVTTRRDSGNLVVTVGNSVFCRAGSPVATEPACLYYAALFSGLLRRAEEKFSSVVESSCRGRGESACEFVARS